MDDVEIVWTGDRCWAGSQPTGRDRKIWGKGATEEAARLDLAACLAEVLSENKGDPVLDWHRANTERRNGT
jgi:hypothetical protein